MPGGNGVSIAIIGAMNAGPGRELGVEMRGPEEIQSERSLGD